MLLITISNPENEAKIYGHWGKDSLIKKELQNEQGSHFLVMATKYI